jgi:enoyl-[acyl-carrier protein] reductase I
MALLADTTGLVMGVANKRSIAWGIAQALGGAGMRLAFTYQGERLKDNVEELAATLPGSLTLPCDVTSDAEIAAVFESLGREFGRLHALVHSLAWAPPEELRGAFADTSREGFRAAHDI